MEGVGMASTVPARFTCPEHATDLTGRVIAEIEDTGLVITKSGMQPRSHAVSHQRQL